MRPSIWDIKVFVVVAETGSLTEAAERLGRTPSAVSMALKQLEANIGAPLFETERKNRLTKVGIFVEDQFRMLLHQYDRTLASVQAFARNGIGRVDVASVPSVAMAILPEVISRFRERWPGIDIEMRDADSRTVMEFVEVGKVELGIASSRRDRAGIRFDPLFQEPLGFVCRHDDALCRSGKPQPWEALQGRVVLANDIAGSIEHGAVRQFLRDAPITVFNVLSLIALVKAGVGITILPRLSIAAHSFEVGFVPIDDPKATRTVGLATRDSETISPAARAFASTLKEAVETGGETFGLGKVS